MAVHAHADTCVPCHRRLVRAAQAHVSTGSSVLDWHDGSAADGAPPAQSDPAPPSGLVADRYLILDTLGAGGMGAVYLAQDTVLRREVALKLAKVGVADPDRVRHEARALAAVRHPNVVVVHDLSIVGDQLAIAMERVRGDDLGTWLRIHRPGWRARLEVLRALSEGLAAAHAAGVVHADVKPENALVDADGSVRLSDFGLARLRRGDGLVGPRGGTPRWSAPEVLAGEAATALSDQFSLARVWEHVLQGGEPEGELSRLPGWLRRALGRALSPRPEDRFSSIHAFLSAVRDGRRALLRRRGALVVSCLLAPFAIATVVDQVTEHRCRAAAEVGLPPLLWPSVDPALPDPAGIRARLLVAEQRWRTTFVETATAACLAPGGIDPRVLACLADETARVSGALTPARTVEDPRSAEVQTALGSLEERTASFPCSEVRALARLSPLSSARELNLLARLSKPRNDLTLPELDWLIPRLEARPPGLHLAEALVARGVRLHWARRFGEAEAAFRRALAVAQRSRERGLEARVWLHLVNLALDVGGRLDDAAFFLSHAEALGEASPTPAMTRWYTDARAALELARGRPERALDVLMPRWREPEGFALPPVHGLAFAGDALLELGRASEASAAFRAQLDGRRRATPVDPSRVAGAMHNLARAAFEQGHFEEARALVAEALRERSGAIGAHAPETLLIERTRSEMDLHVTGARGALEALLAADRRLRSALGAAHIEAFRGRAAVCEGLLVDGRLEEAESVASVGIMEGVSYRYDAGRHMARLHMCLAEVSARRGDGPGVVAALSALEGLEGEPLSHPLTRAHVGVLAALAGGEPPPPLPETTPPCHPVRDHVEGRGGAACPSASATEEAARR